MNRGQKVPSRPCPAKERHRGTVCDGGHGLLGEWFSLPAGGIAAPPPPNTCALHTGLVPGLLSVPLGTDLQPRPVGLPPGLIWRGNVNLEFPTGHRGWEKGQGRARRPAWRLRAEAADPQPPLPPPVARGPTSRQHSTSGWLFQPEGSRADVTSELQEALHLPCPGLPACSIKGPLKLRGRRSSPGSQRQPRSEQASQLPVQSQK